ncbi:MAG: DUF4367 domain-containing protein [Clostridiales bacterium]|nr:DUF4367 domain-containing protein [Clostridiales bacterium]
MEKNEILSGRSLQDRAYDLLGQMLVERETERLLRELEQDRACGHTTEMDAFFARQDRGNLARIQAYCRKQGTKRLLEHTLPRIGKIASVVIAVIVLAGGAAIATSHTVRVRVMRLLVEMEESHTAVKFAEDEEASFDVPAGWKGDSFPSYIPDDLELLKADGRKTMSYVEYADSQKSEIVLQFLELNESAKVNVDTENATLNAIIINGQQGYIAVKDSTVKLFWSNSRKFFLLVTKGMPIEETIKIATSVKPIK